MLYLRRMDAYGILACRTGNGQVSGTVIGKDRITPDRNVNDLHMVAHDDSYALHD